jgi:hypothetical protein
LAWTYWKSVLTEIGLGGDLGDRHRIEAALFEQSPGGGVQRLAVASLAALPATGRSDGGLRRHGSESTEMCRTSMLLD